MCRTILQLVLLAVSTVCYAGPRVTAIEKATVVVEPAVAVGKLAPTLFGVNLGVGDKAHIADPENLKAVRKLHLGSIRFPNGCQADKYNWLKPGEKQVTVEEFLRFCDSIGAEPYYTVNMQGGTEGRDGQAPAGASLDERIKYKHLAPNPCGDTDYYFGTLSEAVALVLEHTVSRALAGKRPLLHYEMGNENWGQAGTDWPPDVYARTVEVYAKAMRNALAKAQKQHPKLATLKLHITAVGFPVMGNNQEMTDTPDYKTNTTWTRLLNDLHMRGVIDAVQEHFYPYGSADGGTLVWATHNLPNILDARLGKSNPRLGGYKDGKLVYTMPMEFTEWNVKCWGTPYKQETLKNAGFEAGIEGWQVWGDPNAMSSEAKVRRGSKSLLVTSSKDGWCEVSQKVARGDFTQATFGIWVYTETPSAVKVFARTSDAKHAPLGQTSTPANPKMWQRVVVGAKLDDEVKEFELVFRVDGSAEAFFDEAMMYSLKTTSGLRPPSCETLEQQLFCVDALRVLAEKGAHRAHLHHLFGSYPCGLINGDGSLRDNFQSFALFGGFVGDTLVKTTCTSGTYRYDHSARAYATDFNALAPKVEKVPGFSAQASRTKTHIFLLLINRYPDREVEASIDLGVPPKSPTGGMRILSGTDIDLPGCEMRETTLQVGEQFRHRVGPLSAEIIAVRIH